jgi:hypothetical protein
VGAGVRYGLRLRAVPSSNQSGGPHQEVFWATAVTERWRAVARTQLLPSAMAGGGSKGLLQLGLRQTGAAQRQQAHRGVAVAKIPSRGALCVGAAARV